MEGIVGRLFSAVEFEFYVRTLRFGAWRPQFIVVHNTSAPDLATWRGWQARKPPIDDVRWMQNLVGYYRDQMKWSAGPHLFITPAGIAVFTPLTVPGVHSPAWNSISWGVETVGEFETEPFDGLSRDNLVAALAILHALAGLSPAPYLLGHHGLHFHKEDPITTHKSCPGRNMVKADLVAAVTAEIQRRNAGGDDPEKAPVQAPAATPAPVPPKAEVPKAEVPKPSFKQPPKPAVKSSTRIDAAYDEAAAAAAAEDAGRGQKDLKCPRVSGDLTQSKNDRSQQ